MSKIFERICLFGFAGTLLFALGVAASGQTSVRVDGNRTRVNADRVQVDSTTFSLIGGGTKIIIRGWKGRSPANREIECPSDTMKNVPVCARTQNYLVATYSNRCFAKIDGATVIGRDGEPCPQVDCHALYLPVCARINRADGDPLKRPDIKAFINSCMAKEYKGDDPSQPDDGISTTVLRSYDEDIYIIPPRKFKRAPDESDDFSKVCPRDAQCPERADYVCARDQNKVSRIYRNRCYAVMDGAEYQYHMDRSAQPCR